jgi:acetolactate synthase-1/2/3 large subunit
MIRKEHGVMADLKKRSGGQILVDQLLIHGATHGFCVPGESYLEVLDALYDVKERFTLVNARHEAGAANMAETWGKLTGRPGIAMVTRGPGATHASVGVHIARQDSTPMILLVGQVARHMRGREAFQEVDYRAFFGPIAKWVEEIEDPMRIPEIMSRAFRTAMSGRPGPVVLSLPEDMLTEQVRVADAMAVGVPTRAGVGQAQISALQDVLKTAERPIGIFGGGWSDPDAMALTDWAKRLKLPLVASFRRQDSIDNTSAVYCGTLGTAAGPALKARLRDADTVLLLGTRLSEISTDGYAFPDPETTRFVHVYPEAEEIGRVWPADLGIQADAGALAQDLAMTEADDWPEWTQWCASMRADYDADSTAGAYPGPLDLGQCMIELQALLPVNAIVTVDAGNHTGWAQRFLQYTRPGRLIGSTCGSMGYAVPAAVAASLQNPDRVAVACVGDGGFQMSGMELATASQFGTRPIILLFNNGSYGTIRMHQERDHPGRVSGTEIVGADFQKLALGLGALAIRVSETSEFTPALKRALSARQPVVIELSCDPAQISTRGRLG